MKMRTSVLGAVAISCLCAHEVAGRLTKLVVQTMTLPDDCKPDSHKTKFGQLLRGKKQLPSSLSFRAQYERSGTYRSMICSTKKHHFICERSALQVLD
jgi:hypothetical protein